MYENGVRHFIDTQDLTTEEILDIVELSLEIKKRKASRQATIRRL